MTDVVRRIRYDELHQLLALYRYLNPGDPDVSTHESLKSLWQEIYADPSLHYVVAEADGLLVSSCTISIIKNLTRNLRSYGLVENVVTHPDYRKMGYGTRVLQEAVRMAREQGCYKVMLMTGSKREQTLRFYEKAGFARDTKTAFVVTL